MNYIKFLMIICIILIIITVITDKWSITLTNTSQIKLNEKQESCIDLCKQYFSPYYTSDCEQKCIVEHF